MRNKTGKVIFAAILLLSFWLVFNSVVYAQTPTPPTRESLIEEIKLRAQKDVELGAAAQTPSDLAVLFSEQAAAVGMTMSEVKNIYDEAYQAATPAKSPWDDLFKPQGGWIFLIIGQIVGNAAATIMTGMVFGAISYLANILIVYHTTRFLYTTQTVIFWVVWLGVFFPLLLASKRQERRAQNPLPLAWFAGAVTVHEFGHE